MADDPLLPLSPRQGAALASATASAAAAWRPRTGSDRLPRVPEQVLVALVGILRAEDEADRSARHARTRVLLRSAVTGAFGAVGMIPTEAVGLIEEARAGVAATLERAPQRTDEQIAADLLIGWELLDDAEQAEAITAGTDEGSLLDALVVRGGRVLRGYVPQRWTPWSTLRLLWRARQLPGLRERFSAKGLRSRGLRAIPVLGAVPSALGARGDMLRFQRRLDAHHRSLGL